MTPGEPRLPEPEAHVYVISVAAELAATRDALREALTSRPSDPGRLPVLRQPDQATSLVLWRRSRH
jgi:hypothetical protein